MRKTLFTLIIILSLCRFGYAQSKADYNWVFGENAGLNFSTDPPVSFYSSILGLEASASISDSEGNLIFYTNGQSVWNSENNLMPNGNDLDIGQLTYVSDANPSSSSITQGVTIIQKPLSDLYYVFYIQMNSFPTDEYGLEYSIVDMTQDGGLGDVTEKNIKIYDGKTTEKLQAVKHANGRDWWIISRTRPESEDDTTMCFLRFLLSPSGVSESFLQCYGPGDSYNGFDFAGQMKFSMQGDLLVYTNKDFFYLYDFDRCTGLMSNFKGVRVLDNSQLLYGAAFSPDGSKLYLSEGCGKNLYQYCLNCDEIIDSTKRVVYTGPGGTYSQGELQLGPDGKIYEAILYTNLPNEVYDIKNQNLCVINFPNELYPAYDFDTSTISLGDARSQVGLPNMPNYNLGALTGSGCDTITAIDNATHAQEDVSIYPNPANTHLNISTQLMNYSDASVSIYTSVGGKVKEVSLTASLQKIDIAELPQGLYTVVIKNENGYFYSEKLVVFH